MDLNLNREIDVVVARLSSGEDPRPILTAFARAVRGSGNVTIERDVYKCVSCKSTDCLCFKCKAVSLVGEQGVVAGPMLIAKLGPMVMGWVAERKAKKQARAQEEAAQQAAAQQAAQAHARRPPPPPGQQRF
jgi:hypothetical protein